MRNYYKRLHQPVINERIKEKENEKERDAREMDDTRRSDHQHLIFTLHSLLHLH